MTTCATYPSVSNQGPLGTCMPWSFESLDSGNKVDDSNKAVNFKGKEDISISAVKRRRDSAHGEDTPPFRKHPKTRDPSQHEDPPQKEVTASTHSFSEGRPKQVTENAPERRPQSTIAPKNCPFVLDDDSDPEEPSQALPASVSRVLERQKQRHEARMADRLTPEQQNEVRARGKRLLQEAKEKKMTKRPTSENADGTPNGHDISAAQDKPQWETSGSDLIVSGETFPSNAAIEKELNDTYSKQDSQLPVLPPTRDTSHMPVKDNLEGQNLQRERFDGARKNLNQAQTQMRTNSGADGGDRCNREASTKARREADEKKAAEWDERELARRNAERLQHEEAERACQRRMGDAKKRMQAQSVEQDAFAERESALSKLRQASKADAPKRITEAGKSQEQPPFSAVLDGKTSTPKPVPGKVDNPELRTPPDVPTQPVKTKGELEWEAAREKRAREKEMRNVKARKAELEVEKKEEEEEEELERNAKAVVATSGMAEESRKPGPMSLQSAAGQRAVASMSIAREPSTKTKEVDASPIQQQQQQHQQQQHQQQQQKFDQDRRDRHGRTFLPILPEDVKLLVWRDDEKISWRSMPAVYEDFCGRRKARSTLTNRYYQVKNALDEARIDEHLRDALRAGDPDALKRLNSALREAYPVQSKDRSVERQLPAPASLTTASRRRDVTRDNLSAGALSFESHAPPKEEVEILTAGSPYATAQSERPQFGGKTLSSVEAQRYHQDHIDELNEQHEEELGSLQEEIRLLREGSPITSTKDYCYFVYQVQRRYFSRDELDDTTFLDDKPWESCGSDYHARTEAYLRLEEEVLRYRIQFEEEGDEDVNMKSSKSSHGLRSVAIEGLLSGTAEVQVLRFARNKHERMAPTTKRGWAPTTVYFVCEVVEQKQIDDPLFDEGHWVMSSKEVLRKQAHTSLQDANELAVKRVVELTFTPTTSHLSLIAKETEAREKELLDELEWTEDLFSSCMESEDGSLKRTVSVEAGTLSGPRNIW